MAVSYEDGMAALKSMFPSWEPQALADLLEANQGHLENTIDMALSMEPPAPAAPAPAPARSTPRSPPPPPAPAQGFTLSPTARNSNHQRTSAPASSARRPRVMLPDDFLRLPGDEPWDGRELSEQEARDAILAEMLQDEIFRQQLFEEREFQEYFGHRPYVPQPGMALQQSTNEKSATEVASETLAAVSDKISEMSEVMKKRMHAMYLRFQTRSDAPKNRDYKSYRSLMQEDHSDDEDEDSAAHPDMRHRVARSSSRDHDQSPRSRSPRTGQSVTRRPSAYTDKKNA
ncbi:TPA: hypothetical protein N0F65_012226 [Lagenidium giganteum]|uniref:CUE domain-containing protein n=1 Tax=Lagenidium giganteum TaxID=4803 RepID=A0AAV2ZC93_9STRA|nr:TPA: hypothetical protein N0F65_012226 [Lagenidium giganteum]